MPSAKPYPDGNTAIIAPSLLSADFACLGRDAQQCLDEWGADWLHVDIMDGHFVPNITIGMPVVAALRKHLGDAAYLDCHCMIAEPLRWVEEFAKAGCNSYTFHIEAAKDPQQVIDAIKKAGMKASCSVKPKTPASAVFPYLDSLDMVLVMTVEPGFGGQSFMEDCISKVTEIREKSKTINIQVDGGISEGETIEKAAAAGANVMVSGSGVFKAKDPKAAVQNMREVTTKYIKQRQQQQ